MFHHGVVFPIKLPINLDQKWEVEEVSEDITFRQTESDEAQRKGAEMLKAVIAKVREMEEQQRTSSMHSMDDSGKQDDNFLYRFNIKVLEGVNTDMKTIELNMTDIHENIQLLQKGHQMVLSDVTNGVLPHIHDLTRRTIDVILTSGMLLDNFFSVSTNNFSLPSTEKKFRLAFTGYQAGCLLRYVRILYDTQGDFLASYQERLQRHLIAVNPQFPLEDIQQVLETFSHLESDATAPVDIPQSLKTLYAVDLSYLPPLQQLSRYMLDDYHENFHRIARTEAQLAKIYMQLLERLSTADYFTLPIEYLVVSAEDQQVHEEDSQLNDESIRPSPSHRSSGNNRWSRQRIKKKQSCIVS